MTPLTAKINKCEKFFERKKNHEKSILHIFMIKDNAESLY